MTTILSFDVGIKNLSYCFLRAEPEKTTIIEWDNLCVTDENCKKIKIEKLTEEMLDTLMSKFDQDYDIDLVLIENQPMLKNGMMKTVSVILYTFFNLMKLQYGNVRQVKFISATNKLKCEDYALKDISSYKDRKKVSIEVARLRVQRLCPHLLTWFDSNKKKDDLSDSLNQAVYFINNVLQFKVQ